jgi:hypothetical protein
MPISSREYPSITKNNTFKVGREIDFTVSAGIFEIRAGFSDEKILVNMGQYRSQI